MKIKNSITNPPFSLVWVWGKLHYNYNKNNQNSYYICTAIWEKMKFKAQKNKLAHALWVRDSYSKLSPNKTELWSS